MPEIPITLEALGLKSWDELYALDPADAIRTLSQRDVPLHPGDAFLAILAVKAVADLGTAARRLDEAASSYRLWGLVFAGVAAAAAVLAFAVALLEMVG